MKNKEKVNSDAADFVDNVMRGKNVDANDLLEKIIRRKVEKHIRKTLKQNRGR